MARAEGGFRLAKPTAKKGLLCLGIVAVVTAGVLLVCGVSLSPGRTPSAPKLNVLFVTMDTTRADRLGCYGYPLDTTPNIDKLADKAVVFASAISQSAVTNTSHASMFTGLNPYHHDVRFLLDKRLAVLGDEHTTMAELFQQSGAQTAAFVSAVPASSEFGLDQGFDHFDETFERDGRVNQRRGDETADAAVAWLTGATEPFFTWVHFFDPHDPKLVPPTEVTAEFKPERLDDRDVLTRAIYDSEVYYMDMQIQRVLDVLERRGVSDRTIVVLVSDHGQGLGDHNWWHHGIIYQEQIHVPMIVSRPGGPTGLRVAARVSTIDLMPTLLAWAGIDEWLWPEMDGRDLTPMLSGSADEPVRLAYSDSTNMQTYAHFEEKTQKTDKLYCVMDDQWKLIYHQLRPGESELYDLVADPKELVNLFEVEAAARQRLMAELMSREPTIEEISGMEAPDMELIEKLKTLGYVD